MRNTFARFATPVVASFIATPLLGTGPSLAAGGLSCTAGEKGITLNVEGGVSHGMGAALFSFSGELTVRDKSVAADLQKTRFALEHVAQYWYDGDDLRLTLYRERDADQEHGYVQAWILARSTGEPDEGLYAGTFGVQVWDGAGDGEPRSFSAEGKIECFGGD